MRDERLLVKDILTALDRIDSYTKGMNTEVFVADEKTVNAVIYNFLVIGEAVKLLPITVTGKYPGNSLAADRGNAGQTYPHFFSLDYELVWKTVTAVLPQFRAVIQKILK